MKPAKNPQGPEKGDERVFRGGSWGFTSRFCRAAFRNGLKPDVGYGLIGFRVVMVAKRKKP